MEFNEYQERAKETAIYPDKLDGGFYYTALALAGEVGELLNKIKKIARDNIQIPREEIISELGDILWYLSETARRFNISLEEVAEYNLKKVRGRKERETLQGSGDNR